MRLHTVGNRQLPMFGAPRAKRVCFFDVGAAKAHAKFSAYTPKALIYFAKKYDVPVLRDPADLAGFDVVLFSLHCFRDYYKLARIAHHKRAGQEWIAGGNACVTPVGVSYIMDYVWIGDCRASFPLLLKGERHLQGLWSARDPDRVIRYTDEDIEPEPLTPSEVEMSKGCPRRCLFCIHPWRHRYQESPREKIEEFIRAQPGKGVGLVSNSSDDVSYYDDIADLLTEVGKTDMIVSNAVQGLTERMVSQRKRELFLGVEGMSERLRWIVNKPIPRKVYLDKLDLCLRHGRQIRTVYQLNLPGEEARDFDEFLADVKYMRKQHKKGSWALPFIPNQPSAHTPFQWVTPRYSVEMSERIMEFRKSMFGSGADGITCYAPAPLGPSKWFSQVIAEWIPITPKVADAVEKLPQKKGVPEMIQALDSMGVTLPSAFLHRDEHTVFPWSNIITTGDDPDKWKRYAGMLRKMESPRFTGAAEGPAEVAA
jgi:hypothetical protein